LHDFFKDVQLTFLVEVAARILDLSYQMFPEFAETVNSFLSHESQSVWSELKFNDLKAAFSLYVYPIIFCSLVFLYENIFFFINTLFLVY